MCARVKIIVRVVKLGNSLVFMNSVGKDEMEWKKILIKTIISDVISLWYNFSTQFSQPFKTQFATLKVSKTLLCNHSSS